MKIDARLPVSPGARLVRAAAETGSAYDAHPKAAREDMGLLLIPIRTCAAMTACFPDWRTR